jgi:hypothetical protein
MINSKPKPNGHAAGPDVEATNPSTIGTRRYRERKRRGAIVLQAEIQAYNCCAGIELLAPSIGTGYP